MLKYTANLAKLKNHIEVSISIESTGLMSAVPVLTTEGQEYIQEVELYFYENLGYRRIGAFLPPEQDADEIIYLKELAK